jgi:hypothetical protein
MEGSLTANGQRLGARDAARAVGHRGAPAALEVAPLEEGAHFMVIEMAQAGG